MDQRFEIDTLKLLNVLDLLGISGIILAAFVLQFMLHELPCPLCLLQRLGLLAIGFGFLLNVHFHPRPGHYSLSLLAAMFTAFAASRQMFLHIAPGSGSYGSALFGLHLYTWVFIVSVLAILYISIVLSFWPQYQGADANPNAIEEPRGRAAKYFAHAVFILFLALNLANVLNVFAECGWQECPDNPVKYVLAQYL